jgi:hypothetical protein
MDGAKGIVADTWYTARDTVNLLDGQVTEATVKDYCRRGTLKGKRQGPRKRWVVVGSSILALRRKWGLDS